MNKTALAVRGLVSRREHAVVLDGIDLDFESGQVTAIVGPNGAGKTTLLRHLAGLDTPTAGRVELRGTLGLPRSRPSRVENRLPAASRFRLLAVARA